MEIRDARAGDAAAIAEIYNDAVRHTTAIWNDATIDTENRERWIAERRGSGFPVLVVVDEGGDVLGYASYAQWRPFDGYRHTVDGRAGTAHPTTAQPSDRSPPDRSLRCERSEPRKAPAETIPFEAHFVRTSGSGGE